MKCIDFHVEWPSLNRAVLFNMQEETCHNHIRVYLVVIVCDVVHFVHRSDMCCRVTYRCPTVIGGDLYSITIYLSSEVKICLLENMKYCFVSHDLIWHKC